MSKRLKNLDPERILVCQLRQIGDVIIATACVELLAARWPKAEIHFLTEAKCAPMLENNPRLARVWTVKNPHGPRDLSVLAELGRQGFDLAVDFQQLPRARWAMLFSRAGVRLTFATKWYKRLFYTHFSHASRKGGYAGKIKTGVLEPLGISWNKENPPLPRLHLSGEEKARAAAHLAAHGLGPDHTLVVLDPTHWSDTRRWPAGHWAEFIRLSLAARPDLRFCLLYGPGEQDQVRAILERCECADRCIPPPDEPPSLRRTAALIGQGAMLVGNCSAPRHMAVALGKPSLTVIGSNGDTAWTFPDKTLHRVAFHYLPCSKCNRNTCRLGTLECLYGLAPKTVAKTFLDMLGGPGRTTPA